MRFALGQGARASLQGNSRGRFLSSAEVVLSSSLFEEVELLEGFESINSEDEVGVFGHSESLHGVLELHVVEDNGGNVVGVLLGQSLNGLGLDLGEELGRVFLNGGGHLGAEFSSVVVPLGLGEADSE